MTSIHKFFTLVSILTFSIAFAQQTEPLTHHMSAWEKELMQNTTRSFTETPPPTGEVRNIAEWEAMESVLVAYTGGFGVPLSLIAEMSQDCNITTIVSGASEENTVNNMYSSNGVNTANCTYVYQDPDSYWTRDYSPWYIAIDDSEVAIVNFPYNRPRPNDNDVPILMANELGVDLYGMDVEHTGGNYMTDGYGIAASSDLVWAENTSQSHAQINTKMQDYLGIDTYHVTIDPLGGIKHIDCWGKFLDVDKVLVTEVPSNHPKYDDYEEVANYYTAQNCSWGYPYEVIRVQAAYGDVNPYTNSLILNNKVFVPQTGSNLDDDAIAVYEAAMPGYEILGFHAGSAPNWLNSDAIHCRAHGVADREMLYIAHYPLHGTLAFQTNYTIEADVVSYGGSSISTGFPKLYYRQNGGSWEEVEMQNTTGNTYTASIPGLNDSNDVAYYIYAENDNSKTESHPRIGVADPHLFSYSGGNIGVNELADNAILNIFPNPSNGLITLNTTLDSGIVTIYNTNGQEVYSGRFNESNPTINVVAFTSGIYIVKVESAGSMFTRKLVVE